MQYEDIKEKYCEKIRKISPSVGTYWLLISCLLTRFARYTDIDNKILRFYEKVTREYC